MYRLENPPQSCIYTPFSITETQTLANTQTKHPRAENRTQHLKRNTKENIDCQVLMFVMVCLYVFTCQAHSHRQRCQLILHPLPRKTPVKMTTHLPLTPEKNRHRTSIFKRHCVPSDHRQNHLCTPDYIHGDPS